MANEFDALNSSVLSLTQAVSAMVAAHGALKTQLAAALLDPGPQRGDQPKSPD